MNGYRLSPVQRLAWTRGQELVRARVRLARPLDLARLQAAVDAVVSRHEALRLTMVHHPGLRVPLQDIDEGRMVAVGAQGELSVTVTDDTLELAATPLIGDPASLRLLLADLATAYVEGRLPEDPEALQFLDVSEWQLTEREQASLPERPRRPAARLVVPHGDTDTTVPVEATIATAALVAGAQAADVSVSSLLFTAWTLALSRRAEAPTGTDSAELVVAWWSDGRLAAGTAGVVGPLGGYAPVRLGLPLPPTPKQLIEEVRAAESAAAERFHLIAPVDDHTGAVGGFAAVPAGGPATLDGLGAAEVEYSPPPPAGGAQLTAVVGEREVALRVLGGRSLLDSLLAIIVTLPGALTDATPLNLIGTAEARWLSSAAGQPSDAPVRSLADLLDAGLAAADPEIEAVVDADGEYSFGDLRELVARVSAGLVQRGLHSGRPVGVLATRSRDTVAAFLGALRCGAVLVPLDPASPADRLAALIRSAGTGLVIGDWAPPGVAHASVTELAATVAGSATTTVPVPGPADPAYVIFTSGSTGTPRPVQVSHGSAAHLAYALERSVYAGSGPGLRVAVNAPLTFDASIKQVIQLGYGRGLYLVPEQARRDGAELAALLAANRVDVLDLTPSQLRILLAGAGDTRLPGLLLIGGEEIRPDLWEVLGALPGVRAINLYGPTECTVDTTIAEIRAGTAPTIGRPLPGARVWVLDEHLRPLPPGLAGELCVSGPQVADGYIGDPVTTKRRFVEAALPSSQTERVYRTGDRVRFDAEGRLTYLGRLDDQVKIHGHRVEPGEIANTLRAHPAVADAAIVARDDGQGDRLVAYVCPSRTAAPVDVDRIVGINPHETRYMYDEIFVQQAYLRDGVVLRRGATVFDVGANIGMFSLFVHSVCPDATIHAFEPVPSVAAALRANIAAFGVPATVHAFGLSSATAQAPFTCYPGYSMMSGQTLYADPAAEIAVIRRFLVNEQAAGQADRGALLERLDDLLPQRFDGTEVSVELRPLSEVIDEIGPARIDLLKIDVQRAEADVLAGLHERHWPLVAQVAMEVHDAVGTATEGRLDELIALLEDHGFAVVTRQDDLLHGTDRYLLHAVRPEYAADPRPVAAVPEGAAAGGLAPRLRDWLAGRLPAHLVPAAVVVLDALPLTPNGKLDRAALPAPELGRARQDAVVMPANRAEEILAEAWQEVLGLPSVGVTDSFFALGGDSIRSIQVQVAARRRGLSFKLGDIFVHQSIRALAEHGEISLADGDTEAEHTVTAFTLLAEPDRQRLPAGLVDAYPMTALQQGMLYHCELTGDPATYHNVTAHRVDRPLDAEAMRAALADLVAAHPVLRTAFSLGEFSEPMQLVHAQVPVELPVEELDVADPAARTARVDELIEAERVRPFDWARPPLLRLRAVREGTGGFTLIVSECHAILDGWSLHLFLNGLLAAYDRRRGGLPAQSRATAPFRRYVELERAAAAAPATRRFWLGGSGAVPPLLLGGPDPRITTTRPVPLLPAVTAAVTGAADAAGVPVKSYLLAMHLRVVGEVSGRDDVVSGLVVGGRPETEGSDATLGLFLNTLPVTTILDTRPLAELAADAWHAEQSMMGHHRFPLAEIVRAGGAGPRFDSFFNFTHFHAVTDDGATRIAASRGITVDVAFGLAVDVEVDPATGLLGLTLQYDGRRFDADWADRLAARYQRLMATEPTAPLPAVRSVPAPAATDEARSSWATRLAGLWQEVIGVLPRDRTADFLAAGGDSLRALRLVTALRHRYGSTLTLPEFVRLGSYEALVDRIARDG